MAAHCKCVPIVYVRRCVRQLLSAVLVWCLGYLIPLLFIIDTICVRQLAHFQEELEIETPNERSHTRQGIRIALYIYIRHFNHVQIIHWAWHCVHSNMSKISTEHDIVYIPTCANYPLSMTLCTLQHVLVETNIYTDYKGINKVSVLRIIMCVFYCMSLNYSKFLNSCFHHSRQVKV